MKLYVSSFSPFVCCCEENNMFTKELLENLKFYLEESKNGEHYKSQSSLLKWEVGYLLLFFNELNKEKFSRLCSFFSDSKLKKEALYAKFGIPLIDVLTKKFEEFHIVVFAENVNSLGKPEDKQLIVDLVKDESLCCKVNPLGRVNAKLKKLYPLYLREGLDLRLLGYACRASISKYIYAISLPRELQTNYQFLRSLIVNLRELWVDRVYSSEELIPKSDVETILCSNGIKISAEVNCEIYDKNEKLVPPYSVLLNKFYADEEDVDLKEKEIGIDDYCHTCRIKTVFESINDSQKIVENLELLTKKLVDGLKEKYQVNFVGKKNPLNFSLVFNFGEEFKTVHPLVKLYVKYSIEFLMQVLLYRYLYVLNPPVRRNYLYVGGWNLESTKIVENGIKCNVLPSTVMLDKLYEEVIVIAAEAVRKYFSGEFVEISLNEQFDVNKSYYPPQFFEKLKKVKATLEEESNEFYEFVSLSLGYEGNFDKVKEFGTLIKELNNECLKDSCIVFHLVGLFEESTKLVKEMFYDTLNEKEVKVYQLFIPDYLLEHVIAGSKRVWRKIVSSIIEVLRLADSEGRLKETYENVEKRLLNFLSKLNETSN